MQVSKAAKLWLEYQKSNSKENSIRAYKMVLSKLCEEFGAENLEDITTERVLSFLNRITEGKKRQTRKTSEMYNIHFVLLTNIRQLRLKNRIVLVS